MVPPKARRSLGVGGLGPNSASPFFFSSSTLAAAGPLAFISFLHTQKLYQINLQYQETAVKTSNVLDFWASTVETRRCNMVHKGSF